MSIVTQTEKLLLYKKEKKKKEKKLGGRLERGTTSRPTIRDENLPTVLVLESGRQCFS